MNKNSCPPDYTPILNPFIKTVTFLIPCCLLLHIHIQYTPSVAKVWIMSSDCYNIASFTSHSTPSLNQPSHSILHFAPCPGILVGYPALVIMNGNKGQGEEVSVNWKRFRCYKVVILTRTSANIALQRETLTAVVICSVHILQLSDWRSPNYPWL